MKQFFLNTSNQGKLQEFQHLFNEHGIELKSSHIDLREVKADPITVVIHKASQMGEQIIVDDTSLDVEGADVGVDVKWLLHNLHEYTNRKATYRVLLAYKKEGWIYVFEGKVEGTIVSPHGEGGFGFDPIFLPLGAKVTLAKDKSNSVNARAKAVEALVAGKYISKERPITNWDGDWQ